MLNLVAFIVGGALLAVALGGSLDGLARGVRWLPLAAAAFGVELLLTVTPFASHPWALAGGPTLWVLSLATILGALARNALAAAGALRSAWLVAAFGVALNLTVVVANGGSMPQSPAAREAAGVPRDRVLVDPAHPVWRNVSVMTPESRLVWLADVIPLPAFLPSKNVMSVGDLLLTAGLTVYAFVSVRRAPRQRLSLGSP